MLLLQVMEVPILSGDEEELLSFDDLGAINVCDKKAVSLQGVKLIWIPLGISESESSYIQNI